MQAAVGAGALTLAPDALGRTTTRATPAPALKHVPISALHRELFTPLRGETFTVATATVTGTRTPTPSATPTLTPTPTVSKGFTLVLNEVSDLIPGLRANDQERFSLLFTATRHSDGELESGIVNLQHRAVGRFELFISPVQLPTLRRYQAIINRARA